MSEETPPEPKRTRKQGRTRRNYAGDLTNLQGRVRLALELISEITADGSDAKLLLAAVRILRTGDV